MRGERITHRYLEIPHLEIKGEGREKVGPNPSSRLLSTADMHVFVFLILATCSLLQQSNNIIEFEDHPSHHCYFYVV